MGTAIHVGTSGYSFKDWVGTVYPEGLPAREFLSYYARAFRSVEINTTYYRVPEASLFRNMLSKVPDDFVFVVKTPREVTHERARLDSVAAQFLAGIEPLRRAEKLGGLLAQFPTSFHRNEDSLRHLEKLSDTFVARGIPVHVEFRHNEWFVENVFDWLRDRGLGFVNVDLPRTGALPGPSNITTNSTAYYRLHGRNARMWWRQPTAGHRYDYRYRDEELGEWAGRILEKAPTVDTVYVFANNCHLGSSYVDALRLSRMVGGDAVMPEAPPADLFAEGTTDPLVELGARIDALRAQEQPRIDAWLRQQAPR